MPKRPQRVRLTLRLDVATEPISGLLEDDCGHARDFAGLLELVSALDSARSAVAPSPHPGGASPTRGDDGANGRRP